MEFFGKLCLLCSLILLGLHALADEPLGSAYLDGADNTSALILLHGRGKHPRWKVVDPVRRAVFTKLGFHTLSLQMPNADKPWKAYADDFPEAFVRILEGIRFLKQEKQVTSIYLLGHSMGGRMASAFATKFPEQQLAGLIVVGCRNNGGDPLSCKKNLQLVDIPVLDVWGGQSVKDVGAAKDREGLVSDSYRQVEIAAANHRFDGKEDQLIATVTHWLRSTAKCEVQP